MRSPSGRGSKTPHEKKPRKNFLPGSQGLQAPCEKVTNATKSSFLSLEVTAELNDIPRMKHYGATNEGLREESETATPEITLRSRASHDRPNEWDWESQLTNEWSDENSLLTYGRSMIQIMRDKRNKR